MERHQAGQEESLVEVRVEMDRLEVRGSAVDRRGCFKCVVALVAVMGLVIVALVVGFALQFVFTSSDHQVPRLSDTAKVNIVRRLKKSDEPGRYDIWTVDKTATYLIYGWLTLPEATGEEVVLMQTLNRTDRSIQKKNVGDKKEIFFFERVKLARGFRISISFKSSCTDSLFHVYEL